MLILFCMRGCGRIERPAFPAPSHRGGWLLHNSGTSCRVIASVYLFPGWLTFESVATHCVRMRHISICHPPGKRVIQYSRDAGDCLRGRCVLDTPLSRGMTAVCGGAIAPPRSRNGDVNASRLNPQI